MMYSFPNLICCYLMTFTFIIFILVSIRKNKDNSWLDKSSTNALKGIAIITVMLHHFSGYTSGNSIFKIIFGNIGFLGVSIFLFISGYGLLVSYNKNKEKYLKSFIKNRLLKIVFIFAIAKLIELVLMQKINNILDWYTCIIMYYYLVFYFVYKYVKNDNAKKNITILSFIPYIAICLLLNNDPYWYNTAICFPLGLVIADNKDKVYKIIKNNYVKLFIPLFLIISIMVGLQITGFISEARWLQFIVPVFFMGLTITILVKLKLQSKILEFFSKISYQLYLLHQVLFKFLYDIGIHSDIAFLLAILINIVIAIIIEKILNLIYRR